MLTQIALHRRAAASRIGCGGSCPTPPRTAHPARDRPRLRELYRIGGNPGPGSSAMVRIESRPPADGPVPRLLSSPPRRGSPPRPPDRRTDRPRRRRRGGRARARPDRVVAVVGPEGARPPPCTPSRTHRVRQILATSPRIARMHTPAGTPVEMRSAVRAARRSSRCGTTGRASRRRDRTHLRASTGWTAPARARRAGPASAGDRRRHRGRHGGNHPCERTPEEAHETR
jgi:hypothetical protein